MSEAENAAKELRTETIETALTYPQTAENEQALRAELASRTK
jgi:hypothetical protein